MERPKEADAASGIQDVKTPSLLPRPGSTPGSPEQARLRVRLTCLQIDREERTRQVELTHELEMRRLEIDGAYRMHQLELGAQNVMPPNPAR